MNQKQTPMMKQYLGLKRNHKNEILFFRMGDFYEMFFEDAQIASKILDIALTARQNDIPMCGIPHHAADSYIARLIKAGERVAICEQLESIPSSGTIVKRDVVRIITPGTIIEQNLLQSDDNNFLSSVIFDNDKIGMAFVDISTGDFFLSSIEKNIEIFRGEITKFNPTEIVLKDSNADEDNIYTEFIKSRNTPIYKINEWLYDTDYMSELICKTFNLISTKGLGITDDLELTTAGSILQYIKETHKKIFTHLKHPERSISSDYMVLDDSTISNLELVYNIMDRTKNRTLFSVINYTKTPMGRRTLEKNIYQPLLKKIEIENRLGYVEFFVNSIDITNQAESILKNIYDVERVISRFSIGKIFPRNFIALKDSINSSSQIKILFNNCNEKNINRLGDKIPAVEKLSKRIESTIDENPAISPEQGRVIKNGFNAALDRLYEIKTEAKTWILNYQEEEKKKLNINTLKIKYNKILGYFIEISKAQAGNIPDHYFRKQTLVSSERFTTEKLQKFESEILSSSDKIIEIEKDEISKLRSDILLRKKDLQEMAVIIGTIDFLISLARTAIENQYVKPKLNIDGRTEIIDGRHPVVEKYFTKEVFIPNDISLDDNDNIIKLITGPNMSGKSTYIRMAAIIQLLAQMGSFIPAKSGNISIVDRIFTRIGASDNISRGESTFLVEMNETANILNNATNRSLIIMDEVGRGTSTYDGMSIAWAIVEYISRYIKAKTLFATHYHELTELGSKNGIVNYNVMVKEHMSGVDFLHKVVVGAADKSYGIHVANLAGIPKQIVARAWKILERMEKKSRSRKSTDNKNDDENAEQLEIFNATNHIILHTIKSIDIDNIKPIDALNELNRLKKLID